MAEKEGAWGFIIRDSDGQGVVAGSGRLSAVADALSAEEEACLAALHAAMARGISRVIVESDSTNLVSALSGSNFDRALGVQFSVKPVIFWLSFLFLFLFLLFLEIVIGVLTSLHAWVLNGIRIARLFGTIPSQNLFQLWWIAIALILGMLK